MSPRTKIHRIGRTKNQKPPSVSLLLNLRLKTPLVAIVSNIINGVTIFIARLYHKARSLPFIFFSGANDCTSSDDKVVSDPPSSKFEDNKHELCLCFAVFINSSSFLFWSNSSSCLPCCMIGVPRVVKPKCKLAQLM